MSRERFIESRQASWKDLRDVLDRLEGTKRRKISPETLARVPAMYRQVCQDLALAKHRQYGTELTERLNRLALRGHQQFYGTRIGFWAGVREFVVYGFPQIVRDNARIFWLANLLFYGPFFAMIAAAELRPEWVYSVIDPEMAHSLEAMYDPHGVVGKERDSDSDFRMFGFYILNNVGISFRTFASGVLLGVGSMFFLTFNGVYLGAIFGHIDRVGYQETFYPFVVGHGSFELTAIVLSGMAGLMIGLSILSPGRLSRSRALIESGKRSLRIMYGAFGMLVIAAFIEGFWSPSSAPPTVKYVVGACLWVLVGLYFSVCGKNRGA